VLRRELEVMMQSKAPVYRNSKDMKESKEEVIKIMRKFKDIGVTHRSLVWNTDLIETLELENLLNQACQEVYGAATTWSG
jgi:succinate dehydrogenase/fumarate reductase flavoprotein subunit